LVGQPGVPTDPSKVESTTMEPEKYLEVGRFKEKPRADTQVDSLARLDFPVEVIQSSRFFGKSYQVLVGPYKSDSEAEAVHKDLSSRGFTPRSYERGTRDFRLRPGLKVGTTYLPVGACVIEWESYIPNAIVKIQPPRGASVTLEGKWVKHGVRYAEDAVVYEKASDGSLALVEIRFAGLREALVFGGRRSP
jgi:tRNA splicing endonuclease